MTDLERFKDVEKWEPKCTYCGEKNVFDGCLRKIVFFLVESLFYVS